MGCLGSEILTRRTATVTISAPDAATAAAFCSKLLYLPVPTISREVKLRPATVHVSIDVSNESMPLSRFVMPDLIRHPSSYGRSTVRWTPDQARGDEIRDSPPADEGDDLIIV